MKGIKNIGAGGAPADMALRGNTKHPLHTAPLGRVHGQKPGSPGLAHMSGMRPMAKGPKMPGMPTGMPSEPSMPSLPGLPPEA